jgi:hypothetical protein
MHRVGSITQCMKIVKNIQRNLISNTIQRSIGKSILSISDAQFLRSISFVNYIKFV